MISKNYKFIGKKGFTLIELLIVIAVLAILAGIVMVALNPMARFQDSRNARRATDVQAILSAIKLNQVDNGGDYSANIMAMTPDTYYQIGIDTTGCNTECLYPTVTLQASCVDLFDFVDGGYLADIPFDPNAPGASFEKSGYFLYKFNSGQMLVGSCHEELGSSSEVKPIEASR